MRYDLMVEDALRGVVRKTLDQIAETGLPGDHHLYVTFLTEEPGVEIPDHLRERYPHEMTIVLQHQFWDLKTDDIGFSIKLSFNDITETLRVPFAALTAFADPSVNFGLQFKFQQDDGETASDDFASSEQPDSTELTMRRTTALVAVEDITDNVEDDTGEDDTGDAAQTANEKDVSDRTADTARNDENSAVSGAKDANSEDPAPEDAPQREDNVIALDAFRKK